MTVENTKVIFSNLGGAAKILSCHSLITRKDLYLHVLPYTVIKKENFKNPFIIVAARASHDITIAFKPSKTRFSEETFQIYVSYSL